jgi:hypothetical protein
MKNISIIVSILFVVSLLFLACTEEGITELGWENGSTGNINDIVWAYGDQTWSKGDTGYVSEEITESKEINELTGLVECTYDAGSGFTEADVIIEEEGDATLSLNEGESYIYTILAQAK